MRFVPFFIITNSDWSIMILIVNNILELIFQLSWNNKELLNFKITTAILSKI